MKTSAALRSQGSGIHVMEDHATQRIDKWLCFARVVKTRSLAAKLVEAGHVRIGGVRAINPAKVLHGGEVLTIALERRVRVLRVIAEAERRGPFREAFTLFEELGDNPCHAGAKGLRSAPGQGADGLGEASGEQT